MGLSKHSLKSFKYKNLEILVRLISSYYFKQ